MKDTVVNAAGQARLARDLFFRRGELPEGLLRDAIERSWQRCAGEGVDPSAKGRPEPLGQRALKDAWERNQLLLAQAKPIVDDLYLQIAETESLVVLTDPRGLILYSCGDPAFMSKAERVALRPGVSWAEAERGTNAIGTAAVERSPVLVHGPEHFLDRNGFLTCSAAPIFDPKGDLAGVLDISGDHRGYQKHTLALVRMSAQMIENRMIFERHGGELMVHLHTRRDYLGTLCEGIIAFSDSGQFLAANRCAALQLGLSRERMAQFSLQGLLGLPLEAALERAARASHEPVALIAHGDGEVHARFHAGVNLSFRRLHAVPSSPLAAEQKPPAARGCALLQFGALESLSLGDARMKSVIEKARLVLGRDIPILVEGESGSGKELFASAFHRSGPRREGPFVAVNCAAIPEGLIESELFGYEEGAFTGARRKGVPGKIFQADGGTLFLDEIGDMPLNLQSRLLRVLQERSVTPLGATRARAVNIFLICATHRRLKEEVAKGSFREDLYYRLNGIRFSLPPLRERTDLDELVSLMLETESGGHPAPLIAPEVMALFRGYRWPGNLRQLNNVIRASLALVGDGPVVTRAHLPEDFLEEVAHLEAAQSPPPPSAATLHALPLGGDLETLEIMAIQRALDAAEGNVSAAARQLGISRNTLYRKLGRM